MSILIKGMEMPEPGTVLAVKVHSDGLVTVWDKKVGWIHHHAISVLPHGRLIDMDELIWKLTPDEEFYPTEADRFDFDNGRFMVRDIRSFV